MNTADAIALIAAAGDADELFGRDDLAATYRRLARLTHPDAAGPHASTAFAELSTLRRARDRVTVQTRQHAYELHRPAYHGDLASLHEVHNGVLKLVREPACNDLMVGEARALRALAERGNPRHPPYVPRLVDDEPDPAVRVVAVHDCGVPAHQFLDAAGAEHSDLEPQRPRAAAYLHRVADAQVVRDLVQGGPAPAPAACSRSGGTTHSSPTPASPPWTPSSNRSSPTSSTAPWPTCHPAASS